MTAGECCIAQQRISCHFVQMTMFEQWYLCIYWTGCQVISVILVNYHQCPNMWGNYNLTEQISLFLNGGFLSYLETLIFTDSWWVYRNTAKPIFLKLFFVGFLSQYRLSIQWSIAKVIFAMTKDLLNHNKVCFVCSCLFSLLPVFPLDLIFYSDNAIINYLCMCCFIFNFLQFVFAKPAFFFYGASLKV